MTTLIVTARGPVTFRKEVLQHLGIKPGEKTELDFLPDGRGVLRAARSGGTIDDFLGLLAGKTKKVATIEELDAADAAAAIRALIAAANVETNRPAVEAGLAVLATGGDFADGVIAYEGHWLGGETFVSFDQRAVALVAAQGRTARLL